MSTSPPTNAKLSAGEKPTLHPSWLAYASSLTPPLLIPARPPFLDIAQRREAYDTFCKKLNQERLSTPPDSLLATGLKIRDFKIPSRELGRGIEVREYTKDGAKKDDGTVIYFHGGGLKVGNLDSEDLSCRRICLDSGAAKVMSISYRLAPENAYPSSIEDAWDAFRYLVQPSPSPIGPLVLVGSSSGAHLVACISQLAAGEPEFERRKIDGVLLRCPVTVHPDAVPERFQKTYMSYNDPACESGLLGIEVARENHDAYNVPPSARSNPKAYPLWCTDFSSLPPHFVQICEVDVLRDDGVCYVHGLKEAGVNVVERVWKGWPHTFWLKAPRLGEAREAENEMIRGVKRLLRRNV